MQLIPTTMLITWDVFATVRYYRMKKIEHPNQWQRDQCLQVVRESNVLHTGS